jgi:hypothetical protein
MVSCQSRQHLLPLLAKKTAKCRRGPARGSLHFAVFLARRGRRGRGRGEARAAHGRVSREQRGQTKKQQRYPSPREPNSPSRSRCVCACHVGSSADYDWLGGHGLGRKRMRACVPVCAALAVAPITIALPAIRSIGRLPDDTLAEWLRRRPAKPMGSPRVGSNPTGVVVLACAMLGRLLKGTHPRLCACCSARTVVARSVGVGSNGDHRAARGRGAWGG